jgi:hypothetical protein
MLTLGTSTPFHVMLYCLPRVSEVPGCGKVSINSEGTLHTSQG